MKIKASELTGPALDWAVAKCEGYSDYDAAMGRLLAPRKEFGWVDLCNLNYSTDWSQGGPLIEREIVSLDKEDGGRRWKALAWRSDLDLQSAIGPTPLIAAMRCYCCSKLGDEVEVPDELA